MTHTEARPSYDQLHAPSGRQEPTGWVGMVVFAGVMLLMVGGFQAIEGAVAVLRDEFYLTSSNGLILQVDFSAYGWTHILLAVIAVATGLGVLAGKTWARVVGIGIAMLSALVNLAFLPAYPVWAVMVITLDVLVIYALTAHGREVRY